MHAKRAPRFAEAATPSFSGLSNWGNQQATKDNVLGETFFPVNWCRRFLWVASARLLRKLYVGQPRVPVLARLSFGRGWRSVLKSQAYALLHICVLKIARLRR